MYLSNLIGKKIYSKSKKSLGFILSPCFSADKKRITALHCIDDDENDFFISPYSLTNFDDGFFVNKRLPQDDYSPFTPILKPIFNENGTFLGHVSDILFEKNKIIALLSDSKIFDFSCLVLNDCIIYKERKSKSVRKTNDSLLLGKKIKSDVYEQNGNLLFPEGLDVTTAVVKTAKEKNKLIELTIKSL